MSRYASKYLDCDDFDRILLSLSRNEPVDDREVTFLEEHRASCGRCRCEASAAELLEFDGTDGPAHEIDELSRRRWVNEIVEQATRTREVVADHHDARATVGYRVLLAAIGIAACASIAIVLWYYKSAGTVDPGPASRVAMTSGAVLTDDYPASADHPLRAGDVVSTAEGAAVLSLAGGVAARLDANTEVRLDRPDQAPVRMSLIRGRLTAAVDKDRKGAIAFTVETRAGRIDVTGTVFSVEAYRELVDLKVLEGRVRVSEPRGMTREVGAGRGVALGDRQMHRLSAKEVSRLTVDARQLRFFHPERAARLTLRSVPPGALAKADEVVLGRTPLSVKLNAGSMELELLLDGYAPARERITAGDREEIVREIALSRLPESSAADTTKGSAKSSFQIERNIDEKNLGDKGRDGHEASREAVSQATEEPNFIGDSALDLLNTAGDRRREGDWVGAARAYGSLLERFPGHPEAGVALIGLGEVQLSKFGRPEAAKRNFDEYLRRFPEGVLAQEAAYGRVRAFRKMNRASEEAAALERFVETYPGAVQGRAARRRLSELRESPD